MRRVRGAAKRHDDKKPKNYTQKQTASVKSRADSVAGRDSSVGTATHYDLDGPGIEFRGGGGEIFRIRPDRPWGPPSLLYNGYRVSFPGVKRPGRGVDHPHPSRAEVKERVELYIYSASGPSWHVLGRTLPLPIRRLYH